MTSLINGHGSATTRKPRLTAGGQVDATLTALLVRQNINNEAGEQLTSFAYQQRDSLDFANVSRGTLHDLMLAAYNAGKAAR